MSSREHRLIIGNADNVFNLNFEHSSEREQFIDVLPSNSSKIKKELLNIMEESDGLPIRDDNSYIIYHNSNLDDELTELLFRYGGEVVYYTDSIVPARVIELIAENRYTAASMYDYKEGFSVERSTNVSQAYAAGKVLIDITINELTPFKVLRNLDNIKFSADAVYLYHNIASETKNYQAEYEWFVDVRDALANWRMNIIMIYNTEEELDLLEANKDRDANIRKSSTVW